MSGEQQESDGYLDGPAYVLDAMKLGVPKGWIMLGHSISEEQECLKWRMDQVVHARGLRSAGQDRRTVWAPK